MNILITGSNGLLGQHLIKTLRQDSRHRIAATARGSNRLKDREGYSFISLDISHPEEVDSVIIAQQPDLIIHAAAMTQVDDCELQPGLCTQMNVQATDYLLRAAEKVHSAFLLLSTDFIFDGSSGPYREEDTPHPLSHYGQSKLEAEELVMAFRQPWAIARTVLVYGIAEDLSRSNIILWVKGKLEKGETIRVVDDQWRTPTLVQDLAEGCRLIAEKKAQGVFNISGRDMLTPYDMACMVADFFLLDKNLIQKADGTTFSQPARRPPRTGFVLEKAERVLGYHPHSFGEGLAILAADLGRYRP